MQTSTDIETTQLLLILLRALRIADGYVGCVCVCRNSLLSCFHTRILMLNDQATGTNEAQLTDR